ncbi:LytR family transcriptional regulator [Candidatus Microgenomates bacterium]|nr:MAG: LytR family transcriptional regulator [Candidatus Microgenomates bacterium]
MYPLPMTLPYIKITPKGVAFFAFVVSLLASSSLLTILRLSSARKTPPVRENHQNRFLLETPNGQSRDYVNVLLLGSGGSGHSGGTLSDTIVVANINYIKKTVNYISVPRDLWTKIPVSSDKQELHKINVAYAIGQDDTHYPLKEPAYKGEHGGGNMAKKTVSSVIGMPIDFYVSVDFQGFTQAIDTLGGLNVNVPVAFEDRFYPIKGLENELCGKSPEEMQRIHAIYSGFELEKQFECRYETLRFLAGPNKMDGETALKFVRSRHSTEHGGDFARSMRQSAVITAAVNKLTSLGAVNNIPEFFNKMYVSVKTDIKLDDVLDFVEAYGDPTNYKVRSFGLTTDNTLINKTSHDGQYILTPKSGDFNWAETADFIAKSIEY